jgi:hypothetical protein
VNSGAPEGWAVSAPLSLIHNTNNFIPHHKHYYHMFLLTHDHHITLPVISSFMTYHRVLTRLTRRVSLVEQKLLKQQSAGRHVAPLGYIISIPSQPVFALSL